MKKAHCKTVGISRGSAPHPALPRGWSKGVISSPAQAEPYPGTSGGAAWPCRKFLSWGVQIGSIWRVLSPRGREANGLVL
jgi:hypothetical protein